MKILARQIRPDWIKTAEKLKALAHPVRLHILHILHEKGEMSVLQLQQELKLEQAVVSHHLIILKGKQILMARREGKNIFYSLKDTKYLNILSCIEKNN